MQEKNKIFFCEYIWALSVAETNIPTVKTVGY